MTPFEAARIADGAVEGWVGGRIHQIIDFVARDHDAHGVTGDIVEIGVHHGRLFFIMASILRPDETAVAIDVFGDQALNIDASGSGDRQVFEAHARTLFPDLVSRLRIIEADSLSLNAADIRAPMSHPRARLISVDGGHTAHHASNDLRLAQDLIAPRGVVMLDDFFNPYWSGVTDGFYRFMATANRRLAPVLFFQNKLFLTTISEHAALLSALADHMRALDPEEFAARWAFSELQGFRILAFRAAPTTSAA